MKLRPLFAILMLAFTARALSAPLTAAGMQEDLRYLREVWSHTDRSLDDQERREFDKVVDTVLARVDALTPADFALEVARVVATARNGHTGADIGAFLHGLPVGFAWFADGLFIVRAEARYSELLGARVEKLGALSPDAALAKAAVLIPGNEAFIRSESAVMLRNLEVLHYIGATRDRNSAVLQLRLRDGRARKLAFGVEQSPDPAKQPAWMGLVPAPRDVPGRWVHVLDAVPHLPSLYRSVTNLDREWWQDNRMFYLRSNYVWGTEKNRYELFDNLIGVLQVEVAERRPKYAIVDLRLNRGGDFFNTINFAQALPKLLPPDGRIYVLVGPDTFSAAIATAAMLKDAGGDQVLLVGDEVGDYAEFWSEGRGLKLPHSGINVGTATKRHNWEKACTDPTVCYWGNTAFGPKGISLQPSIRVPVRFADYAAGRDPVLEAVLKDAGSAVRIDVAPTGAR